MLRNTTESNHCAIEATDGTVGQVKDLCFDDDAWVVRDLVVEIGPWLDSRKVLSSPIAIQDANWPRLKEERYADHYHYPYNWAGAGLRGDGL